MKKLTIEEYKEKIVKAKQKAYEILADNSAGDIVYVLREISIVDGKTETFCGIAKSFEALYEKMTDKTDFLHTCDWVDFCIKDYISYEVHKFHLTDYRYQDIMNCRFDIDGEMLHYKINDERIKIDAPHCKNVERLFENGDIVIVNRLPFDEPQYGVYLYDENDEKPHILMTYDQGYACYWITKPEQLEKVEDCPVKKINKLNKTIKKYNGDYKKAFKKKKITMDFVPF